MQTPAVPGIEGHEFSGDHMPIEGIRIHPNGYERKGADLLETEVRFNIALHCRIDFWDVCNLPRALHLLENRKKHALLAVCTRYIGTPFALTAIVQHCLAVKVL